MYVDIGSVSNHLDPLDGGQVGITMLELDEVTVVDSDLKLVVFTENDELAWLTGDEGEAWLVTLLVSPVSSQTTVPHHNSILETGIEVESNLICRLMVLQVDCKLSRSRGQGDVDQSAWK